ncbi:MAG TPA: hypothetical protein VGS27_15605 [Candidatus Sulfotelmatobacter sp.]|nr:hypothetical protein [Candidatus Sulfotelmatobacter sp.]
MNRTTTILASVVFTAFICTGFAAGQQSQSNSQNPEDAFSARQLIAWSGVQKPQPAPQPLPPRDTPVPQPDQPSDQQATPPADPHSEQTPSRSFTGKIVKDGGEYVLKGASHTYHLDQQEGLQKYANEEVRVVGSLDPSGELIRIVKIELVSTD